MKKTIDIQSLLEWTYAVECADTANDAGYGWTPNLLTDSAWTKMIEMGMLGCKVKSSGGPAEHQLVGYSVHADAMSVHREVIDLPDRRTCTLVMINAKTKKTPDPLTDERIYIDPRAAAGEMKIAMQYRDQRNRNDPISCTIPWMGGDLDMIADARGEYALWRCALDLLVDALENKLTNYIVTRSKLPYEPWAMESQDSKLAAIC